MKKISFQEAQKRFKEQGRTDIQICEEGFNGWKKKSKFWDNIEKDYFWAIPRNVFQQKSSHPKRAQRQREQTNIKKYGNICSLHGEQIKEKTRRTVLEKHGVEHILQSQKIKEKIKQTCLKKYGVGNPSQSEEIKEKKKQTVIKNFGVEHQMHSAEVKDKIKQTNFERYKVEHPSQSDKIKIKKQETLLKEFGVKSPFQLEGVDIKMKQTNLKKYGVEYPLQSKVLYEKAKQTNLKKYGTEYAAQSVFFKENIRKCLSNRFIKETGEHLSVWLEKQPEPRPAYSSLKEFFPNEKISLIDLENYLKNYENHKSNLEIFTENLFNIKHFNRKPENFDTRFKPDFQLNDQIYLNVDGLYWHCEEQRDKWYHFNLRKEFEENGLQIFQFYGNELLEKTDIIKSIVDNATKKISNKIFARKCEIKSTLHKEAQIFLNQNHLMGSTTAKHIGLYHQDELVSILSYKHKKQKTVCNIERFCSKINTNIVGGFSRLLKHLELNCLEPDCREIHNWVDLRYGTGKHLLSKGFEIQKETLGWRWTDCKTTYNRLKCRANMDSRKLTEQQQADELNWYRVYDAGQRLYVKNLGKQLGVNHNESN